MRQALLGAACGSRRDPALERADRVRATDSLEEVRAADSGEGGGCRRALFFGAERFENRACGVPAGAEHGGDSDSE